MIPITPEALTRVDGREALFAFLRDQLGWPLDPEDTFTYGEPLLNGATPNVRVSRLLPFGAADPFLLLLAEWETPLLRSELREILRAVRARIRKEAAYGGRALDEIVFVCPSQGYHSVWFAHFEEQEGRQPRLEVFGWDAERVEATRTLREVNLPALAMPPRNLEGEPDWAAGYSRWLSAWDVESVTRAFFKDYRLVFDRVKASLPPEAAGDRTLWTQRLFNRLLFIHFLSQKREGWLRFAGRKDYLQALWEDYGKRGGADVNFYRTRLRPLFFTGLNNKHVRSLREDNPTLYALIGDVPYLNGGLFEKAHDDDAVLTVPDPALGAIMDLFGRYRFTITESTPDDVEVAVDPEMLGKVFEELVTGRHESGSYYTPRPVVAFMCREALKGYLGGGPATATLVDGRSADDFNRKGAADLLRRLSEVRVVDPACGSGAYLLGMLHELYELTGLLEVRADLLTPQGQYKRKLGIIQNALYGVDLDPFAVNVARLRLWLSLAVEHTGDVPEPLPNLDFKVEVGDSLASPLNPDDYISDLIRLGQIDAFKEAKDLYGSPDFPGDRKTLDHEIQALKGEIAGWLHQNDKKKDKNSDTPEATDKPARVFEWQAEFAEVFKATPSKPGGFDIVLANPPYIRMELFKDKKVILKQNFPEVHAERADLYCYFYARAVELLNPGGMLVFISPNKWYQATYGAKLREHLAKTCRVVSIIDFGDLPVFQTASAYPTIFVAQKTESHTSTTFTPVKTLSPPYPDIAELVRETGYQLPSDAIQGQNWRFSISSPPKIIGEATTLGELVKGQIFRGIVTGLNSAFCISDSARTEMIAQNPSSITVIKQLIVGEDVRKWYVKDKGRWLLYMSHGIDIADLEAPIAHLRTFREELENRATKQQWYELQQPQAKFAPFFEETKIIYPQIMIQPRFTLDRTGSYINQKCFIIRSDDLYLLGTLNSSTVWKIIIEASPMLRGGYTEPRRDLMLSLPIPVASDADRAAISALVQHCLDAKGVDCQPWEAEIDARVAALYGL